MTRVKQVAVVFTLVLAAAQLVRPERANPPIDPSRTIQAQLGTASGLVAVLDRSCRDCHSNATEWRWYTRIAPLSWLMARAVAEGREAVNFSEWGNYLSHQQREMLALSCQAAVDRRMPGPYTWIRPETRLSAEDIGTICMAARRAGAPLPGEEQP